MALLTPEENHRLESKIGEIEKHCSAEFKVVICKRARLGAKQKAHRLFKKLGLESTAERNAVMLMVVEASHELLIYGDTGIYEKTSTEHWPAVCAAITDSFKQEDYYVGLSTGIEMISANLIEHFPAQAANDNEISNEIIYA